MHTSKLALLAVSRVKTLIKYVFPGVSPFAVAEFGSLHRMLVRPLQVPENTSNAISLLYPPSGVMF